MAACAMGCNDPYGDMNGAHYELSCARSPTSYAIVYTTPVIYSVHYDFRGLLYSNVEGLLLHLQHHRNPTTCTSAHA
jgi:hypothetical protein